jgi:hypothetical protein
MSAAEGHEPPQVPHWIHISRRETPGVAATTSSKKLKSAIGGSGRRGRDSVSVSTDGRAKVHLLKDE